MPTLDQAAIERNCCRLVRRCARNASNSILGMDSSGHPGTLELWEARRDRDMLRGIQLISPSDVTTAAFAAAQQIVAVTSLDGIEAALCLFDEKRRSHHAMMARLGRAAT